MTYENIVKEMRKLIQALPKKKTDEERLFLLGKISIFVAAAKEPLKRRQDKRKKAYHAQTKIIKKALKQFLIALERIEAKHEEIGDTDVREKMYNAIHAAFILGERGYSLPPKFGMFSGEGNTLLHIALRRFLTHPEVVAAPKSLNHPQD